VMPHDRKVQRIRMAHAKARLAAGSEAGFSCGKAVFNRP